MRKLILIQMFILIILTSCFSNKDILKLEGDIQNVIISANSTIAGKIIKLDKKRGEVVKKSDIIAIIDNTNPKYVVEQLQAVVDMKRAKLNELQAGTREQQIDQGKAQVDAAKAQLELLLSGNRKEQVEQAKNSVAISEEALNSAKITYDRLNTQYKDAQELYNKLSISKNELDDIRYKFDTAEKQLSTARYQLESAKQQLSLMERGATSESIKIARANYDAQVAALNLLKSGATSQTIDMAKADLDQAIAQLQQAKNNLENCNVVALNDGIIISQNYELGDVVNVGSNIADIAVKDDVYVMCYIPVKYLDKIKYNQVVDVETPQGVQKGRISYIDLESQYTPKDKQSTSDRDRIATKIKVDIDDKDGLLKSGLKATVNIPLK